MTLGHSRHGYEEAVWDQKLETFLRLHERAFRDLGGVAARHSPRQSQSRGRARVLLRSGQSRGLSRVRAALGLHAAADAAAPAAGKRQAGAQWRLRQRQRAEGPAASTASTRRMRFCGTGIAPSRACAFTARRAARCGRTSSRSSSGRCSPSPARAFPFFTAGERTVHTDGHVEVGGAFYPVPLALLGQRVRVQWDAHLVRVFHGDTLVVVHAPGRGRACLRRAPARPRPRRASRRLSIGSSASASASGPRVKQWADAALAARGVRAIRLDSGRPRPHASPSARAHPRRRHRGARAPALSLSDHSPARRAHAGSAQADARHRRSGDSSHDPVHLGGLPTMNPQLTTRLRHLRLSGMVEALPGRVAQAEAAPLAASRVSRAARRGRARPTRRSALRAPAETSRHHRR